MKMLIGIFLLVCLLFPINTGLVAQEWTDAQKEILKQIEESYELWVKKDVEGFLNYIHDDYCGWHYESGVTQKKSSFVNMANHYFPKTEVIFYELTPLNVQVLDDVAIVHYYFYFLMKDSEGKEQTSQSRYTDILLKENDRWLLISDHGGEIKVK
jgi:ketosteroid isomerase-like protein